MISFQVKTLFFDQQKVLSALDQAARRVLSKFGAYVRRAARSSIRKRRRVSPPGQPPSSHEGSLRKLIFFSWDPERKSVVIGPLPFRQGQAPALLEFGGTRIQRNASGKTERQTFAARPFMGPAFQRELPQLDALWLNSIRK